MNGDFHIGTRLVQPSLNLVRNNGTSTRLEPKVMQVLLCLAERPGQVLLKEELLRSVWRGTFVSDDVLTRAVSELRRALEDDARRPQVIQTIAKKGYRLLAPVRWLEDAAPETVVEDSGRPEMIPQPEHRFIPQTSHSDAQIHVETRRIARRFQLRSPVFKAGVAALVIAVSAGLAADLTRLRERKQNEALAATVRSIAVLPLANLSSSPEQEYLSEGLTDALITELSQMGDLKVISRTTSNRYKGAQTSLPQIARDLGVDGIVEGTVQRAQNRLRVTAQLVYAPADRNLWARSYERELQDSLQVEEEIAASIAHEIRIQLSPQQQARMKQNRQPKPQALDDYLRGRYHLSRVGRGTGSEDTREAIRYFKKAIAEDPNFALAYTFLADAYDSSFSGPPRDIMPLEKAALSKALQLDPDSAKAHQLLGCIHFFYDWDWAGAEAEFKQSLELDPNSAWTHDRYSLYLAGMGRSEQALAEAGRARTLDPSGPYGDVSEVLGFLGRYDEAVELTRKYVELYPNDGFGHWNLYHWYAAKGMQREAISELELTWKLFGFPDVARAVHEAEHRSGYRGALPASARALEQLYARKTLWLPEEIARTYRFMGDKEQALIWLGNAYRGRGGGVVLLEDAVWMPLRSDARFQDLVQKVGLPPWRRSDQDDVTVHASQTQRGLNSTPFVSARVLDAYYHGNYYLNQLGRGFGDEPIRQAGRFFQQAIEDNPSFVQAYIGLARAHGACASPAGSRLMYPTEEDYNMRRAAVLKAAELAPDSADVHLALGDLDCTDWKWAAAEREYRRAIALNSHSAPLHGHLAAFLWALGRNEEAEREDQKCQELDPINENIDYRPRPADKNQEALYALLRELAEHPDDGFLHYEAYQTYASLGRYSEAVAELEQTLKLFDRPEAAESVRQAFVQSGFKPAMKVWAAYLEQSANEKTLYMPGVLAEIYATLGDKDRAFYWLEHAYQHKYNLGFDGGLLWLKGNQFYGPLRGDPRFADLVRRVGLP